MSVDAAPVSQALPLAATDEPIDYSQPPEDGMEYLRRVAMEAKLFPDEVLIGGDTDNTDTGGECEGSDDDSGGSVDPRLLPHPEWEREFLAQFKRLRQANARMKVIGEDERAQAKAAKKANKGKSKSPTNSSSSSNTTAAHSELVLPRRGDEEGWRELIVGDDGDGVMAGAIGGLSTTPPLCSVVHRLDQAMTKVLIEYIVEWLDEGVSYSSELGAWIFALLVQLDSLLEGSAVSSLRQLLRHLLPLRDGCDPEFQETKAAQLNVLICILGRHFGQTDLLQPYE